MKVLWITNILFPEAKTLISKNEELKSSGGWMLGLANELTKHTSIELHVATVSDKVSTLNISKGRKITYYTFPKGKGNIWYDKSYEGYWKEIYSSVNPDIVHIHGTEYSQGLAFIKACPQAKTVISIQGLTSAYYYYYYGVSKRLIIKHLSFRDIIRKDTLLQAKNKFKKRGEKIEIPMIKSVSHIIGRTEWDKAHAWAINPKAKYHFCNEILRNEFYSGKWEYEKCTKHTIFLSQAGYPIKGLHQLLKAMPLVLREYPDTKIRIAGGNIIKNQTLRDKLSISGYGLIIRSMLSRLKLWNHIDFLGGLNSEEMKAAYLDCNVFICPSTIENSPNSLGEAQILGVPCIASYVGGINDMIPSKSCGKLYRFEEVEMLAKCIIDTFRESDVFDNTEMRRVAAERHSKEINTKKQISIYNNIINEY